MSEAKQMTNDPEIEQEAERMYDAMTARQYVVFRQAIDKGNEGPEPVDVLHEDLMDLLRDHATLRRGAEERAEIVSALPDSFFADRSLSERVLRMVREWQRVLTILQKQEDQSELAALSAPLDNAKLREIEERAAYLKAQKRIVDDGNWKGFDVTTAAEQIKQVSLLLAQDVETLLAALRSRGGEGEGWIPCSERLPKSRVQVFTYDPTMPVEERISRGMYFASSGAKIDHIPWQVSGNWVGSVTHWRPLLSPPKAVSNA